MLKLRRWKSNLPLKVCDSIVALSKSSPRVAVQHMATYWSLLEKVRGSNLQLTKIDSEILEHFQREFPDVDVSQTIDEDKMKSKEGKDRWRKFMMTYESKVADYNFGTMLRSNPKSEYGEKETIFGSVGCLCGFA